VFLPSALNLVGVYVLVLFRVAGMMVFAPLLGSARIPKRVKAMVACVLAAALAPGISSNVIIPQTSWELAIDIGGEIIFGLAIGMILSFIFVAAQWAGQMMGQQMGLNLGETFDPQFGAHGSMIGDLYYFLALIIFLAIDGHQAMIRGVRDSFDALPLLSVGMNRPLLGMVVGLFGGATMLAMRLSAPLLVTMLVVDTVLGFIGKTVPQLNIMTTGLLLRSLVGLFVMIVGLTLTSDIIRGAMMTAMKQVSESYTHP
jgi:flagellar biosynthesis protein FliR